MWGCMQLNPPSLSLPRDAVRILYREEEGQKMIEEKEIPSEGANEKEGQEIDRKRKKSSKCRVSYKLLKGQT